VSLIIEQMFANKDDVMDMSAQLRESKLLLQLSDCSPYLHTLTHRQRYLWREESLESCSLTRSASSMELLTVFA